MTEPENRRAEMRERLLRVTMLQKAQDMIGQERLAEGMGLAARSLRAKLSIDRGLSDDDLRGAAGAVEARAAELAALAGKIRDQLGVSPLPLPANQEATV
jgi:hypothetical protein